MVGKSSVISEEKEYRETELGLLPKDWKVVSLGEYLDILRNGITKKQNKYCRGFPVSRIETISTGRINPKKVGYLESLSEDEIRKYKLVRDDLLFSHINSEPFLGNSAIYEDDPPLLIHGMNLLLLRTKKGHLDPRFLNYLFNFYRRAKIFIGIASRAVNQSSINQGKIKALRIPLPPLSEQKKIAFVLSVIQEAKEKTEQAISATRELKKSLMEHLFKYGPVSLEDAEKVRLKETEIGEIPEEWEVKELSRVSTLQRGKDLPKRSWKNGNVPIVGSSGVMGFHDVAVCKGPGVITGRSGSIGKVTYVESDYWPHNTGLYVKDFHGNDRKFVYYLLHTLNFRKYATGVSVPTLNRNFIHKAKVKLPPLPVQKEIASILSAVDERIEKLENKRRALEELFKSMLENLMTARIRVNHLEVDNDQDKAGR